MRKDRNAFFQEAQMQASGYYPSPGMMTPPVGAPMPYQQASHSANFYAGPQNVPYPQSNMQYGPASVGSGDIESRIAKIERQINRLEARINQLENNSQYPSNTHEDPNYNSSMYMV